MRPDPKPPRPRLRRIVLLLAGLAAGVALVWIGARALLHRGAHRHEAPEAIDTDRYLGPLEMTAEPGTGEHVAPFSGFAVSVETEPQDALVTIAGVERGESPVFAGIDCTPGTKVPIRVEKAGFRPVRATTVCRTDALVKVTVRLGR